MVKILVVDDEVDMEPLITQKFRRKIHNKEWEMIFRHNGQQALEVLQEDPSIDIVLSDINMPQMDGLTLTQKIQEEGFDIRTVIVSAYGDIENIRTAMNNGAFDFITKPINFKDMEHTITRGFDNLSKMKEALQSKETLFHLKKELSVAHDIQQSILPKDFNLDKNCQLHGVMTPAKEIGGDFYDCFKIDDDHVAVIVADVSGKGVAAALFALITQTVLKGISASKGALKASAVIEELNKQSCKNNDSFMFVTLFYGVLNTKTGKFTYVNAGHNPPFLVHTNAQVEELPLTGGIPLGLFADRNFLEKTIEIKPNETVFIYTDGVTESMNSHNEEFTEERLEKILSAQCGEDIKTMSAKVHQGVKDFAGSAPQFDDLTYLALRYLPQS
ncbi:MAG: SpoIIE family protein phosphatase [Bdellovibrionaceae bacterium]|nr:SpoIIE family protein phosphatase [Pseudobdellovibrionaceae bacterium]